MAAGSGPGTRSPLGTDSRHLRQEFDRRHPPIATVRSGDVVRFVCPGPALGRDVTGADQIDMDRVDVEHPHVVVGPVSVDGAGPGDVLQVDVLDVAPSRDWGHCILLPGFGLLGDRFPGPHVRRFLLDLEDGVTRPFPGVRIRLRPFCGIMALAPAEPGPHSTVPPRAGGGNVDINGLTAGSTLYLPVQAEGAVFYCGDGHAAQGRGEVCGTALETALDATLRFTLRRDMRLDSPAYRTFPDTHDDGPRFAVTAFGPDLYRCSREATSRLVDHLAVRCGIAPVDAYVLCSVTADLAIEEIVDHPNWMVSASVPLDMFEDADRR